MAEWTVPGYTELEPLASGGFGDVAGPHDAPGTLVAIKYQSRTCWLMRGSRRYPW